MRILLLLICVSFPAIAEVLIIGDSLTCGPFGSHLLTSLAKTQNKVTLFCAVSSAPTHWLSGKVPEGQKCQTMNSTDLKMVPCADPGSLPKLTELLRSFSQADVIVALGTNSLLDPLPDSSYKTMATMVSAKARTCRWIGPPRMNPDEARGFSRERLVKLDANLETFYPGLETTLSGLCTLYDSRPFTKEGTRGFETVDGVHRTEDAGAFWSDNIYKVLNL